MYLACGIAVVVLMCAAGWTTDILVSSDRDCGNAGEDSTLSWRERWWGGRLGSRLLTNLMLKCKALAKSQLLWVAVSVMIEQYGQVGALLGLLCHHTDHSFTTWQI